MMMSQVASAEHNKNRASVDSRVILLLDCRKAYDTVDRDFLYEALRTFGFGEQYIQLIYRLHSGATASFLINEERSEPL